MQSIPIPTDNIFKFYALFGLALFATAAYGYLYLVGSVNQETIAYIERVENSKINGLEEQSEHSTKAHLNFLNSKYNDLKGMYVLFCILGTGGLVMSLFGFIFWHTVYQKKHDYLLDLTIEKSYLEVEELKNRS